MKVVQIVTTDGGGAGIAALRLHKALRSIGVDSSMICLYTYNKNEFVFTAGKEIIKKNFLRKILKKIGLIKSIEKDLAFIKFKNKIEAFSFANSNYDLTIHSLIKDADVINLHWVDDLLDYKSFFKKINIPVVWTLHDMNPFMGGFHYKTDFNRFPELHSIDNKILKIKNEAINSFSSLTIVYLSEYIGNNSIKSEIFRNFEHIYIPNGINLEEYKPHNKEFACDIFNLPSNKFIILFVADNIMLPRKGFDLIVKAMKLLKDTDNIHFVSLGKKGNDIGLSHNYTHIQTITDSRLLSILYSSANILIIPSLEDNLPNTMLESFACGTPVIAFNTGGLSEHIKNGLNGLLIEDKTAEGLSQGILKAIKTPFDSIKIRNYALTTFDAQIQAQKYKDLYVNLINVS